MMEYNWRLAEIGDTNDIVAMAKEHFENEIDTIFTPEVPTMLRNVTFAIINQIYYPGSHLLTVCRESGSNRLLAYTWAKSNDRACWSDDAMVVVCMVHVDLTLSSRTRIRLIQDMMDQWEKFARYANNPIICSTTMRHDQTAFLKLHERAGYSVRGSYAYKRIK